jgi:hypothetical protein
MIFILMVDRIKCCLNPYLQILTVAPALHSLIVRDRKCVASTLKFLSHGCAHLRKLILNYCNLGKDGTGLLTNIVTSYPDLECLSLKGCHKVTSAGYGVIARLKKLSELNLSHTKVHYVYVNVLQTHMCIWKRMKEKTPINTFNVFMQEGNSLQFYILLQNINFSPQKNICFMHLTVSVEVINFS